MSKQTNDRLSAQGETRRAFLAKTAALGTAAFMAGCSTAQSKKPRVAKVIPKARPRVPLDEGGLIRMGVIGTGGMGTGHCHGFMDAAKAGEENVQIVALCDVCQPRLEAARKACEGKQGFSPDTYGHYPDLLARDDIHGVLIASPEHWHGQMARDAILAGKDVYLEKPMTLLLDDALHLRKVVMANPQQIFQVGTQKIMLPKYGEAKKLIADGAIGKPTLSQTSYCRNSLDGEWLYYAIDPSWEPGVNVDWEAWCGPAGPAPWDPAVYARWRRYRRYSTGIVGDLLVHVMTPLILSLDMGWPTRVVATGGHYVDKPMENHDQVNINVEFEGEHTLVVAGSTCNEVGLETMIRGHEANIYLGGRHCVLRPERHWADIMDEETIECPDIGNDQQKLRLNWLASIRSRQPAMSNVDLASKVMVIVDLATRSMWEGSAFEFDPKTLSATKI